MGKNKNGLTDEELKAEREREVKKENLPRKLIKAIFEELGPEGVSVEDIEEITSEMHSYMKRLRIVPQD